MSEQRQWAHDARLSLEVARDPSRGEVYLIGGPDEARVTIYSQQCRALNLVCALRQRYPGLAQMKIAVVGAGAAGMTAAAALRALDVPEQNLVVYERAARPMITQWASYTRFLHPRLFHWPEPGWRGGDAALPLGGWTAGIAHEVRGRLLAEVEGLPIRFCTEVLDLAQAKDGRVEVTARQLGLRDPEREWFDIVLVATGFAVEEKPPGMLGGTYWHAIDGLATWRGDVHVIGDGDGALTEILMLFIDRLGHGAVEQLCSWLRTDQLPELDRADIEAQGDPTADANPNPAHVRTGAVTTAFGLLARERGARRRVVIHGLEPVLGSSSFLLNRVLVSHLKWLSPQAVEYRAQSSLVTLKEAGDLGSHVVWRVGVGGNQKKTAPLAVARLTSPEVVKTLRQPSKLTPFDAGLLGGLVDHLRRPQWTRQAEIALKAKTPSGWTADTIGPVIDAQFWPSAAARSTLADVACTLATLERIGLGVTTERIARNGTPVVSIDVLTRAASCAPADMIGDGYGTRLSRRLVSWPRGSGRDDRVTPPVIGAPPPADVFRGRSDGRLWFRLPDVADGDAGPMRGAVSALVEPAAVRAWARQMRQAGARVVGRPPHFAEDVPGSVLDGLGDVAGRDAGTHLLLAALFEQQGDWDRMCAAYVRAGRAPGERRQARGASVLRRVLGTFAHAMRRMRNGRSEVVENTIWMLIVAAAADVQTLDGGGVLELRATDSYLRREWGSRVRRLLMGGGRGRPHLSAHPPPDWALPVARLGLELRPTRLKDSPVDEEVEAVRQIAQERLLEAPSDAEAPVTLADFGVWPASLGGDLDGHRDGHG
jgi:hypothetical protein